MRYNKTEAKFKSHYILKLSPVLGSLLSMTMMYRLREATESAILFIPVAIVFVLGI